MPYYRFGNIFTQGGEIKNILIGLLGFMFVIGFYFIGVITVNSADDNIDLQIQTDISTDNGQTWQTTALPCQNDTITIRTRIWNAGTAPAYHVTGQSSFSNNTYIASVAVASNDSDGDGNQYARVPFTNNGSIYVPEVNPNTTADNGSQGATVTVQMANICPTTDTQITTTTNIQGYSPSSGGGIQGIPDGQPGLRVFGIGKAHARGIGNNSKVAIAPCACHSVTAQATITSSSSASLPQTGADLN